MGHSLMRGRRSNKQPFAMWWLHWLTIAFGVQIFLMPSADGRVTREPSVEPTTDPGWMEPDETEYESEDLEYETEVVGDLVNWRVSEEEDYLTEMMAPWHAMADQDNWGVTDEDYDTEVMADQGNRTLTEGADLPKLLDSIQPFNRSGQAEGDAEVMAEDDWTVTGEGGDLPTDDIKPLPKLQEEVDLPTLPEAIQLFQLESMNKLRQTIQSQEEAISEKQTRIEELGRALADKDLLIVSMTEEGRREKAQCETENTRLAEEFAEEKEVEKEQFAAEMAQCETEKTQLREEFAAKNEEDMEIFDAQMAQCETEKTQLEAKFTAENVEEAEQCEAEKTQLKAEFANQILEKDTKCEEARVEIESQTTQESERMDTKLGQCESTIVYMGNVMLQNNQGMLEGQRLLESQANTIKEANKEIKRHRDGLLICETAANSTALQGETIASLRSALTSALNFTELLSTKDLEQLQVEQWTKDLMESNIEKKQMIDDLNAILKKGNTIEDSMLEVGEGLANLTSIMESATVNLNIVDQQADVIQKQAKSIAQLTPLLRHTSEGVVWYEKAEAGGSGVESISSCSCLPRSADSNKPTPARIEYHCGDTSNRTFSLPCSGGLCESEALPSCTEPMEWEEESASVTFHHCEETLFNGDTLFCSNAGSDGTREMKITSNTGGGVVEEVNVIHCLDCTDLLTWTAWGPCTSARGETTSGMKCRRKGNDMNGFEEEKKGVVTSPNYPRSYPNNLMKMEKIRVDEGMVLTLQFTAFNTEQCCDKLTIRDENGKTLMESRGGDDLPPNIESRTNVYLDFHTDRDTVRSGWSVNWYARVDA